MCVSIIIPIYKVEAYLDKCIESVVNQTYKNLEIILVDDGSPDNCPKMCDDWAKKDDRIKVIHKENGGVSSARNAGLDVATGTYITFVDSDDWLDSDAIQTMTDAAIQKSADMVICDFYFEQDGLKPQCVQTEPRAYNGTELMKAYLSDEIRPEACAKLIRTACLKQDNLRFDTSFGYGEDMLFNYRLIQNAKSLYNLGICKYHYLQNSGNSSTTAYMTDARAKSYLVTKCFVEEQTDDMLKEIAVWRHIRHIYALLTRIVKSEDKQLEASYFEVMQSEILQHKSCILQSSLFSKKHKLATVILNISPALFKLIIKKL